RCGAAAGVGRTQQRMQFAALGVDARLQRIALRGQLGERGLLPRQFGLGLAQRARRTRHLLVGRAQLPGRVAALALQPAPLAGDVVEFLAHALQAPLGLAAVALGQRFGRGEESGDEQHQRRPRQPHARRLGHPRGTSRVSPVISAGLSSPSRTRIVGARSRSAPPARSCAARLPTYTRSTGPTVCEVCASPVTGSRIISQLPWSAVTSSSPPLARTAATISPTARSTVSTAVIAADSTPVWPTMSGLAKLQMIASKRSASIASTSRAHTSGALISGCRS